MLITGRGDRAGALSGGCLEDEVAVIADKVMQTGAPILLEFDTRRLFGCHGSIEILIEPLRANFLESLSEPLKAREEFSIATAFLEEAPRGSRVLACGENAHDGEFVQRIEPAISLLILGDGPDSRPLRAFAANLGWQVQSVEQASELPERADPWTAAIVKSHNYGRDYAALQILLPQDIRYVGIIGPRKRRDQLLADLLDRGISINAEVFAPAGLDLAAETPEEIALSIVAEIQSVFAGGTNESLRDSKAPIHAGAEPATRVALHR